MTAKIEAIIQPQPDAPDHPRDTWQEERGKTQVLAGMAFQAFSSAYNDQTDAVLGFREVKFEATCKLTQAGFSNDQRSRYMSFHTIIGSSVPYESAPKIDFPGEFGLRNFYIGVIRKYGAYAPEANEAAKKLAMLIKQGPIGDFYQDILDKLPPKLNQS